MGTNLLLEYIALLSEKIRSRKVDDDSRFNMRTFQSLPDYKSAIAYADKYLQMLGRGSSRATWLLNSRQVLKIALSSKGNAQNEAEIDVYTNPA